MLRARKIVRASKEGLTEQERYAVADHVVRQLKVRGYPLRLDDEAKSAPPTHDLACSAAKTAIPWQIMDILEESCLVKTWDGDQTDETGSQD